MTPGAPPRIASVRVEAPARLHLGFIDVSGSLGRRFGSLGLTLADFQTVVEMHRGTGIDAEGPGADRALAHLRRLLDDYDPPDGVRLQIHRSIPEHVGLGSGTQMAFAIGRAFGLLFGIPFVPGDLATRLDRGARSGIGIGAFCEGGFVVDGGRAPGGGYPPLVARLPFPPAWRVLLVFDGTARGLHGESEREAFQRLRAFPQSDAARLAHLVLMAAMPALVETDCPRFGAAIGDIQRSVGDHFAIAQGGRFASPAVAEVLAWIESRDIAGIGQTSWGPTGFAIIDSEVRAHALVAEARQRFAHHTALRFAITRGRNEGHTAETRPAVPVDAVDIHDPDESANRTA
ncbi:MAG: beta-ribofuranosylaminobenzene 5'-phosphate synthase [Burkholderiales bacterium]|nr:beta-ribofuranosylaminobenzene 5'-phosphate synthase [Burkholderiales bacterium]